MALEPTRELVLKKLRDCFPDDLEAANALAILDGYGVEPWHAERDRVHLAILMESGGSFDRLRQMVDVANNDYRDVLVSAEYPQEFRASGKDHERDIAGIRESDRERYEKWLKSDGK